MRLGAVLAVALAAPWAAPAHAAFTAVTSTPEDGILNIDPSHSQGQLTLTFQVDTTGTVEITGDGLESDRSISVDDDGDEVSVTISADEVVNLGEFFDLTLTHEPDDGAEATTTVSIAVDATLPDPPSDVRTTPANGAIVLTWTGHVDFPPPFNTNVERYIIYYASSPLTGAIETTAAEAGVVDVGEVGDAINSKKIDFTDNTTIDDLENGVSYYFAIEAIDHAGNRSGLAANDDGTIVATLGIPVVTNRAGELTGVDDRCFIASAALGGDSTWVDVYRAFRDRVLLRMPGGEALVEAYYRNSPPHARALQAHPGWRFAVRVALVAAAPAVAVAAALGPAAPVALMLLLATTTLLLLRRRTHASVAAAMLIAATAVVAPAPAQALDAYDPEHAISLQTGRLLPKQARRLAVNGNGRLLDYRDMYGEFGTYRIELAYDFYPFDWGGRWGIGGKFGFAMDRGKALAQDAATGEYVRSGEDATFLFFPTSVDLRYRGQWVDKQPLMPVLDVGFDFWPFNESQESASDGIQNFVYGWHVGGELELSLNWIEPDASYYMNRNYKIHGTSLFAGYHYTRLDDFGRNLTWDFSNHDWYAGLRFLF